MPNLRETNVTIIWGCGHRKAFKDEQQPDVYSIQVSDYPCAERCDGWYWGDGPSDITIVSTRDIEVYVELALTGTDEDRMNYPFETTRELTGAISCWLM